MDTKSILICGVGGQGVVLSSDVLSEALFLSGYDVKKNEIHGMSQREGAVTSLVRFGKEVFSPSIPVGTADYIVSFEKLEALRNLHFLKKNGVVLVNSFEIMPVPVILGAAKYPDTVEKTVNAATKYAVFLPGMDAVKELGNPRVVNTMLLGALSHYLPEVDKKSWDKALKKHVKEGFLEVNMKAFEWGRHYCQSNTCSEK